MKRVIHILAAIVVASVFHSCGTEYFECTVMSPETDEVLPQEENFLNFLGLFPVAERKIN